MSLRSHIPEGVKRRINLPRTRLHRWRRRHSQALLDRLAVQLVSNPVLYVDEVGGEFEFDPRSRVFQRLLLDGSYEPALLETARNLARPDRDVIDVGANVGFYSVALTPLLDRRRRIIAIEPNADVADILRRNLERNGMADRVSVLELAAASDSAGRTLRHIIGKSEFSTIGRLTHPAALGDITTASIETTTLDQVAKQYGLEPGFIKIDVEGAEDSVLAGAVEVMGRYSPIILCELSDRLLRPNGSSFREVIEFMARHSYRAVDPLKQTHSSMPTDFGEVLFLPVEHTR